MVGAVIGIINEAKKIGRRGGKGKTSFTERATMVNHGRWRQVDVCYGSLCFDDHIIVTNLLGTYGELDSIFLERNFKKKFDFPKTFCKDSVNFSAKGSANL